MSYLPPIGPGNVPLTRPTAPAPAKAAFRVSSDRTEIPPSPPPEVTGAVATAAAVVEDLHARGRELHFGVAEDGKLTIQVRDLDGAVVRNIPATEALDIASGQPLD